MGITLRNGSPLTTVTPKLDDYPLMPDHVKAMFHEARSLRSQLLVSLGNDLGWRINDVLSIKKDELPDLDQEPPIEWLRMTEKEHQVAKSCLSKTSVALLKEYVQTFDSQIHPYLFFSSSVLSQSGIADDNTINGELKFLAQEAKIKLGNLSLTWQCFRKMIISTAKNMSIDPDIVKLMTGKAVDKAMLPYLRTIDVRTAFTKLQTVTGITTFSIAGEDETKSMKAELQKYGSALAQVENENSTMKFRFEQQQKRMDAQIQLIEDFTKKEEESKRQLFRLLSMDFKVRLQLTKRNAEFALEGLKAQAYPKDIPEALLKEMMELRDNSIAVITEKLEKLKAIPEVNTTIEALTDSSNKVIDIEAVTHEALNNLSTKHIIVKVNP